MVVHAKVDDVFATVMEELGVKVPLYNKQTDPVIAIADDRKEFVRALKHPPEHRLQTLTAMIQETKPEIVPKNVAKSRKRKLQEENDLT